MFDPYWYRTMYTKGAALALALCLFAVSGCDSASTLETNGPAAAATSAADSDQKRAATQTPPSPGVMARVNADLEALAYATAKALADEATARFLHEQVLRRFDGDTNVLLMDLEERATALTSTPAGRAWSARVAEAAEQVSLQANRAAAVEAVDSPERVRSVVEEAEALYRAPMHLYWYKPERWDRQTAPWVAVMPVEGSEGPDLEVLPGFDAEGNRHVIDDATAASRPVVVLTYNERVGEDGEVVIGGAAAGKPIHCPPDDPDSCSGGGGGGGGAPTDADYPGYLKTEWLEFSHDYEGWPRGDPEFVAVFYHYVAGQGQPVEHYRLPLIRTFNSGQCDGRRLYLQNEGVIPYLFPWRSDLGYMTYVIQWIEEDGGILTTLEVEGTYQLSDNASVSATAQLLLGAGDDKMATITVNHDDPSPNEYNLLAPSAKIYRTPVTS